MPRGRPRSPRPPPARPAADAARTPRCRLRAPQAFADRFVCRQTTRFIELLIEAGILWKCGMFADTIAYCSTVLSSSSELACSPSSLTTPTACSARAFLSQFVLSPSRGVISYSARFHSMVHYCRGRRLKQISGFLEQWEPLVCSICAAVPLVVELRMALQVYQRFYTVLMLDTPDPFWRPFHQPLCLI
jgi:hypothetical protein